MKASTAGSTLIALIHSKQSEGHAGGRAAGPAAETFPSVVEAAIRGTHGAESKPVPPGARAETRDVSGETAVAAAGGHADETRAPSAWPRVTADTHGATTPTGESTNQRPRSSENGAPLAKSTKPSTSAKSTKAVKSAKSTKATKAAESAESADSPRSATPVGEERRSVAHDDRKVDDVHHDVASAVLVETTNVGDSPVASSAAASTAAPAEDASAAGAAKLWTGGNTNGNADPVADTVAAAPAAVAPLAELAGTMHVSDAIDGGEMTPPARVVPSAGQRALSAYAQTHAAAGNGYPMRDLPVVRGRLASRSGEITVAPRPERQQVARPAGVASATRQPQGVSRAFEPAGSSARIEPFDSSLAHSNTMPPSRLGAVAPAPRAQLVSSATTLQQAALTPPGPRTEAPAKAAESPSPEPPVQLWTVAESWPPAAVPTAPARPAAAPVPPSLSSFSQRALPLQSLSTMPERPARTTTAMPSAKTAAPSLPAAPFAVPRVSHHQDLRAQHGDGGRGAGPQLRPERAGTGQPRLERLGGETRPVADPWMGQAAAVPRVPAVEQGLRPAAAPPRPSSSVPAAPAVFAARTPLVAVATAQPQKSEGGSFPAAETTAMPGGRPARLQVAVPAEARRSPAPPAATSDAVHVVRPASAPIHAATPAPLPAPIQLRWSEQAPGPSSPFVPARPHQSAITRPVQSRTPAAAPAHPMSPVVAPMSESVPSPIILAAVEPRRVRAAVLEMQHRVSGASDVATAASRNGFDTLPAGDKGNNGNNGKNKNEKKFLPARVSASAENVNPFVPGREGSAPTPIPPSPPSSTLAGAPVAAAGERPRAGAQRPRGSAAPSVDGALAAFGAAEIAGRLMVPALPLIPAAAPSPPSAGLSAPGRQSAVDGATNVATTTREKSRGGGPDVAANAGAPGERTREAAPRPSDLPPVTPGPRGRTTAEPMHPVAGSAHSPSVRSDGAPAPFVPMPAAAAPLMNMAAEDPSLHAAALGKSAHVRLDTGADGELGLHMVIKDGVVDLRVDGAAARTLDIRPDEVRTALAGEGISLGRFETSSAGGSASGSTGGYRDGATDQGAQNAGGQATPSTRQEPSFADAAAAQTGGGQTPAQNGSGGGRHFDGQDRWIGRDDATPARPAAPGAAPSSAASSSPSAGAADSLPRRGYHVTA